MTCHALLIAVTVMYFLLPFASGVARCPRSTVEKRLLLYPFEYDGHQDWELVPYDDASVGVVTWMMGLKDWLTVSRQLPLGQNLMVCFRS